MQHLWKRLITFVLAFAMVFSMASIGVDARAAEISETEPEDLATPATQPTETTEPEPTVAYLSDTEVTVTALEIEPVTLLPGVGGGYYGGHDEATGKTNWYYAYNWEGNMNYKVTFSDGSVFVGTDPWFEHQGRDYYIACGSDQWYASPWTPGNTYIGTAELEGISVEVPVTILDTPVENVTVEPITLIENYDGQLQRDWLFEQQEYSQEYFCYDWHYDLEYTVTFKDGSTYTSTERQVEYNGESYEISSIDEQCWNGTWTVGNTYAGTLNVFGYLCDVPVTIEPAPVKSISFEPISIMDGQHMSQNNTYDQELGQWVNYDVYDWGEVLQYTATLQDGSVIQGSGDYLQVGDREFWFGLSDDQTNRNRWSAGNTYKGTVEFMGITATVDVTIEESPIASITVEPIELIDSTHGYMDWDYNSDGNRVDYFKYSWWNYMNATITFKDGTVAQTDGGYWFDYNGEEFSLSYRDAQNAENIWSAGNTYTVEVWYGSVKTSVEVKIAESPATAVQLQNVVVIENNDGGYTTQYNEQTGQEETYYCYSWWYKLQGKVIMHDGSTATISNGYVHIGDYGFLVQHSDTQSVQTPWKAGNTYPCQITVLGYTVNIQVEVSASPFAQVRFFPISMMENDNCGTSYEYDPETGVENAYNEYWWYNEIPYSITTLDGTVLEGRGNGVHYNGSYHRFNGIDDQGYGKEWTGGNSYPVTISFLGKIYENTVTIEESPVQSIAIEPITMLPETYGNVNERWSEQTQSNEKFYEYYWWNLIRYTVTFSDGTVAQGTGSAVEYNGETYWFNYDHSQYSSDGSLEPGTTTTITVSLMGAECQVPVTIAQSPVQSVKLGNVALKENSGGYYSSYQDGMTGSAVQYYVYNWQNQMSYEITFTDGSVVFGIGNGFWYQDQYYMFADYNRQSYDSRMLPGNTYTVTVGALGVKAQTEVAICQSNAADGYEFIVQGNNAIITNCTLQQESLQIPETLGGYGVVGITDLGSALYYAKELVIPDSVTMLSDELFGDYDRLPLQKLTLGAGVQDIFVYEGMLYSCCELQEVAVSADNPYLASVDGVLYNKDITVLLLYPAGRTGTYTVPDTVTNIDLLFYYSGIYSDVCAVFGDNIQGYKKVDGVLYDEDMTHIYRCDSNKTGSYVMPDTVTSIAYHAFEGSKLQQVTVSKNVTGIVYAVFADCVELEKVELPAGLTQIGMQAFYNCEKLTDVQIPSGLRVLEHAAFAYSGITSADLPGTLRYIGSCAFANSDLASVTIAEGIEEIGYEAFAYTKLTSVVIPDSVYYAGSYSFSNCQYLTSVKLSADMVEIPYRCFANTGLTTVTIPENVEYVGGGAFSGSKLVNVVFENKNIAIGGCAFENCPLASVNLSEGVSYVGDYAFAGIAAKTLKLPESLTDIAYRSFAYSEKLETIDVSNNLQSLCGLAFEGTAWMEKQPDGPVYLENYFYNYKGVMPDNTHLQIQEGTKLIADYACAGQDGLVSVYIPASVVNVGEYAFAQCYNLERFEIAEANTAVRFDDGVLYVNDNPVWRKAISVAVAGGMTEYAFGQTLDRYEIRIEYVDGTYSYIYTRDPITGYNPYQPGEQLLTVVLGKLQCSFTVTVAAPEVTGIEIVRTPDKTTYALNQPLRTGGMILEATYAGGTFAVADYAVSGYDPAVAGEQTVTVSYKGFEDTFAVTVDGKTECVTNTENGIEVNVPNGALESDTQLMVDQTAEEQLPTVPEVLEDNKAVLFDIRFEKDGVTVQPEKAVEVSIPVPADFNGKGCKVFHVAENGEAEDMKARYEGGYLTFTAAHFSYYAVVQMPGVEISGTVSSPVAGQATVTLLCGGQTLETVVTENGSYSFQSVAPNSYTVVAVMDGCSATTCDITVENESIELNFVLYKLGDMTMDGTVSNEDVVYLLWHTLFPEDYAVYGNVDFTGDGAVTNEDVVLLLWHTLFPEDYPLV